MQSKLLTHDTTLILAASFFYMASPMLVTPLITGFSEDLGAAGTVMGLIGGLMNLCSLFCRPFVGNLTDKISKYKLSFIGAVLMLIGCIGYIIAGSTALIIISRIINGIGFSCCSVCMSTWMSNMLPKDKIGSGMGLYGTMNALSMAIAPAIGVAVSKITGYRTAFMIAASFALATMIVIQFVHDKGECPLKTDNMNHKTTALVDKNVIPIALIIMLFAIPYCATQSFLVRYTEVQHFNISVGLFFPIYAAFLLILRLSLKSQFDKLPFGVFVMAGCVSAIFTMICLTLLKNNLIMLFAALFMAGGYGIMCSVCQSTAILLAGKGHTGLANSTYYIGLDSGMTLGPIIGGILYGNIKISLFYPVLMLTVPLILIVYLLYHKTQNGTLQ